MPRLKPRLKTIPLDFLGEEWRDCTIAFRALTFQDLSALDTTDQSGKAVLDLLRAKFVSGRAVDDEGQPFDLAADDLDGFDIEAVKVFVDTLTGTPDPNA
jgi:hypothetical protein